MTNRAISQPWQKIVILFCGTATAVLLIGVLSWGRAIFIPMAVAMFLAFVLSPVVRLFQRMKLPRVVAVIGATTVALLLLFGLLGILGKQLTSLTLSLPDHKERIVQKVGTIRSWFSLGETSRLGQLVNELDSTIHPDKADKEAEAPPTKTVTKAESPGVTGWAEKIVSPAAEGLSQVAFAGVLVFFILLSQNDLRDRLIRLIGDGRVTQTTRALDDASSRISDYLLKQLIINLTFGVIVGVGLALMGVDYALLWGSLAAAVRYLPYIGTWIGVIPPTIYSFAVSESWWPPIAVLAFILTLELLCNNLVEPFAFGKSLGVSEVAQIVAAGVWSFIWGPIGLILSGPLTTCLLVLGKNVPGLQFLDVLLGHDSPLDDATRFYQRLAARDDDEANRIFQAAIKETDVPTAIDRVIVPAMQLIRRSERTGDLPGSHLADCLVTIRESAEETQTTQTTESLTPSDRPRIWLIPTRGEIDATASAVLATQIPESKWAVEVMTTDALGGELVARIERDRPELIVISSVGPGGLTHLRSFAKRIESRCPDCRMVICRFSQDDETTTNSGFATTITEALNAIAGWRPTMAEPKAVVSIGRDSASDTVMSRT